MILLEIGVRIGGDSVARPVPSEVRDAVLEQWIAQSGLADAAIRIAQVIQRKLALDQVIVVLLVCRVGAEGVSTDRRHHIRAVDPDLHRARIGHGHAESPEHRAADHLGMGVLGIEIDAGLVLQLAIGGNLQVIIVRVGLTGAMAAVADPDIVAKLGGRSARHHAVGRDKGGVHRRVAV